MSKRFRLAFINWHMCFAHKKWPHYQFQKWMAFISEAGFNDSKRWVFVLTSSLHHWVHAPLAVQQGFIATTIFGCDRGPNVTTVGSVATVLWLLILRRRGLSVSSLDYFKVGIAVTPLMLVAGAFTIWLLLP